VSEPCVVARKVGIAAVLAVGLVVVLALLRPVTRDASGERAPEERTSSASPQTLADAPSPAPERADILDPPRTPLPPEARIAAAPSTASPAGTLALRLEGRVLGRADRPIAGAEVRLRDERVVARSDADGRIDAALALAPDELRVPHHEEPHLAVLVTAAGHRSAACTAEASHGAVVRLGTLRLDSGGDVAGTVTDEAGAPLAGALVVWRTAEEWPEDQAEARRNGVEARGSFASRHPEARTDALGRFRLRGVATGRLFVVASADLRLHAWSDVFEVRAGATVERALELPLDAQRFRLVKGRVLDPGRRPAAGVEVVALSNGWPRHRARTDESGAFVVAVDVAQVPQALVARDAGARWSPSARADAGGAGPFELVLAPARTLELRMQGSDGAPVGGGSAFLTGRPWDPAFPDRAVELDGAGRACVLRPEASFSVHATAPFHRSSVLGPFVSGALGDVLVLALEPTAHVRGRVVAASGRPVAGARLGIEPTRDPAVLLRSLGTAELAHPFTAFAEVRQRTDDATADAEGRFALPLAADGWHAVSIAAEGFPTTTLGPFAWTAAEPPVDLELVIGEAGAIEGRLLSPPGQDPTGRIVGVSSGWGVAWTAPCDAQGRFRIDGLAPGRYQLRPCRAPAASRQTFVDHPCEGECATDWDCEVVGGGVSRCDLDLRGGEDFVLGGRFMFGPEPERWRAFLYASATADTVFVATAPVAPDGSFELRLARGGPLVLVLSGESTFLQPVELAPGRNEWTLELGSAEVTMAGALGVDADGEEQRAFCRWSDGALVFQGSWSEPDGRARTLRVPSGRVELRCAALDDLVADSAPMDHVEVSSVIVTLDLAPGSRTVVDLAQPR
jgi:hypothetical protein